MSKFHVCFIQKVSLDQMNKVQFRRNTEFYKYIKSALFSNNITKPYEKGIMIECNFLVNNRLKRTTKNAISNNYIINLRN